MKRGITSLCALQYSEGIGYSDLSEGSVYSEVDPLDVHEYTSNALTFTIKIVQEAECLQHLKARTSNISRPTHQTDVGDVNNSARYVIAVICGVGASTGVIVKGAWLQTLGVVSHSTISASNVVGGLPVFGPLVWAEL